MVVFFAKLQEAMEKDRMEYASEPSLNLKTYLANAYLHPIFHMFEQEDQKVEATIEVRIDKSEHQRLQHVRSSHSQYEEETSAQTHYHHEERSSSQYQYQYQYQHEETHIRSEHSPPHFVYHPGVEH